MKYQKALLEKNLTLEDVSKKIKDKVQNLHSLLESGKEVAELESLDLEAEKLIQKFDLEKYQARVKQMAELTELRKSKAATKAPKIKAPKITIEDVKKVVENEVAELQQFEKFEGNKIVGNGYINKKLEKLKEDITIDSEYFNEPKGDFNPEPEPEILETEEIKEFEKTKIVRPKSEKLSIIIMMTGGFLFCWGIMMYLNSKKQNR